MLSAPSTAIQTESLTDPTQRRLQSLDMFRGLTIAAMILINNPGHPDAAFAPLRHAAWHGWTIADLVFPFYLFILGASLLLSYESRLAKGGSRLGLVRHICLRSLLLIALGLVLNGAFYLPWTQVRIPGVLQRIGIVYLFAALITMTTTTRVRAVVTAVLLLGYWVLMMWTPVPGHGPGALGPNGNLASYVDRHLLRGHLWRATWDPEGILSTLPAIGTALIGTFAAELLRATVTISGSPLCPAALRDRIRPAALILPTAGLVAALVGVSWARVFPINKSLWTSSFALLTAGLALLVFSAFYWLIDVRGWRHRGGPLLVLGMNPLAIYAGSEMVGMGALPGFRHMVYRQWLVPSLGPQLGSFVWAIAYLTMWCSVAYAMYRRRIFIKL